MSAYDEEMKRQLLEYKIAYQDGILENMISVMLTANDNTVKPPDLTDVYYYSKTAKMHLTPVLSTIWPDGTSLSINEDYKIGIVGAADLDNKDKFLKTDGQGNVSWEKCSGLKIYGTDGSTVELSDSVRFRSSSDSAVIISCNGPQYDGDLPTIFFDVRLF